MAWGSSVTFFGAGMLALVVPQLIHAIGLTALLGLFAYVIPVRCDTSDLDRMANSA